MHRELICLETINSSFLSWRTTAGMPWNGHLASGNTMGVISHGVPIC